MKIFGFHLMPWPYLKPEDISGSDSSWVTMSNALYDPVKGHQLYDTYFRQLVMYDEVGFDGISVNEHHQTAYGLMPSANMTAAMLLSQVKGTVALLGNALSLSDHPLKIAEEVAYLDVVSGGRIISGFVRGIGAEYHSFSMDPSTSRERFYEAHDLIIKAWTDPGPFEWYGKHYKFRYVNPWPRPYQQPHPPIWSPSQAAPRQWNGQRETSTCIYKPSATPRAARRSSANCAKRRSVTMDGQCPSARVGPFRFTSVIRMNLLCVKPSRTSSTYSMISCACGEINSSQPDTSPSNRRLALCHRERRA